MIFSYSFSLCFFIKKRMARAFYVPNHARGFYLCSSEIFEFSRNHLGNRRCRVCLSILLYHIARALSICKGHSSFFFRFFTTIIGTATAVGTSTATGIIHARCQSLLGVGVGVGCVSVGSEFAAIMASRAARHSA